MGEINFNFIDVILLLHVQFYRVVLHAMLYNSVNIFNFIILTISG